MANMGKIIGPKVIGFFSIALKGEGNIRSLDLNFRAKK